MKQYILTTALTVASTAALAQGQEYNYDYGNYNYDYNYNAPSAQNYQQDYYLNQPVYQEEVETTYYAEQPVEQPKAGNPERNWNAHIMVGLASAPEFKGSKDNDITPLILPQFTYKLDPWQKLYISLDEGAGYSFQLTNNVEIGGGLTYRQGRDSKDSPILAGLSDVDNTLAYSGFIKYKLDKNYRFGIQMAKGMDSSNDGITTELFAGYSKLLTPQTGIDIFVRTVYGDDDFMKQNFGVSSGDATSFRPAYDADAGFYKASIRAAVNHHIAGPHSVTAFTTVSKLLGDAKDSSVVEDDTNIGFGAGYTYKF